MEETMLQWPNHPTIKVGIKSDNLASPFSDSYTKIFWPFHLGSGQQSRHTWQVFDMILPICQTCCWYIYLRDFVLANASIYSLHGAYKSLFSAGWITHEPLTNSTVYASTCSTEQRWLMFTKAGHLLAHDFAHIGLQALRIKFEPMSVAR